MLWKLLLMPIFFLCAITETKRIPARTRTDKVVVCYVGTWAVYRPDGGNFQFGMGDLDPSQCTHLIYSFAKLNDQTWSIESLDPYLDLTENYGRGGYKNMTALRRKYNDLKVTLAIGGWNEGSAKYSTLAASESNRRRFVDSVVKFLRIHDFDGLDLDWEFPGKRGGNPEKDKDNFVLLVKELSRELKNTGMILTSAINANKNTIDLAYNIPELSKYLDYIHIMAYDYHGSWDGRVLPNTPLSCGPDGACVEETVQYLLRKGAPSEKLVLGLALYGRTFILASSPMNTAQSPIGSPSLGTGFEGPFTKEKGFMGYNEICRELTSRDSQWKSGWDDNSKTSYALNKDKVIVYDDAKSLILKVNFAKEKKLAGVMVWSIDTDDFHGDCEVLHREYLDVLKNVNFPLMRIINQVLTEEDDSVDNEILPNPPADHDDHHIHHSFAFRVDHHPILCILPLAILLRS